MPTYNPTLLPHHTTFLQSAPLFFTATAPLHGSHINLSPKGLPSTSLAILSPTRLAYLDHTGSGCETIAHLYDNARLTLMACSFGPSPKILRLFCRGSVVEKTGNDAAFAACVAAMRAAGMGADLDEHQWRDKLGSVRAVVVLHVWKVQTSCGYGVPLASIGVGVGVGVGDAPPVSPASPTTTDIQPFAPRSTLLSFSAKLIAKQPHAQALLDYQRDNNSRSLDGCPGLKSARRARGEWVRLMDGMDRVGRVVGRLWEGCLFLVVVLGLGVWLGWVRVGMGERLAVLAGDLGGW